MGLFEKLNISNKRDENETREQYISRRNSVKRILKHYLKGQLIYNPKSKVRIPKTTIDKEIIRDEEGNIVFHDKLMLIGPYRTKLFGRLLEFGSKKQSSNEDIKE